MLREIGVRSFTQFLRFVCCGQTTLSKAAGQKADARLTLCILYSLLVGISNEVFLVIRKSASARSDTAAFICEVQVDNEPSSDEHHLHGCW